MIRNYDVIDSIPAVECFRNTLPKLIAEYEVHRSMVGLDKTALLEVANDPVKLKAFMDQLVSNPTVQAQATRGFIITQCAEHFYGFQAEPEDSVSDIIAAVKAADAELEV